MFTEPLIDSVAHLRHIFSHLLLAEKLDVHPVHLAFFAIADEKICTESVPPHSIRGFLRLKFPLLLLKEIEIHSDRFKFRPVLLYRWRGINVIDGGVRNGKQERRVG